MKVDYNSPIGKSLGKKTLTGPYVGLELEYENCKGTVAPLSDWHTDIDHSLRIGGLEFISKPLKPIAVLLAGKAKTGGEKRHPEPNRPY